jgi:formyltetrahydrofolate deformylase
MLHNKLILLISSPDQKGLVYKITEIIFQENANIVNIEQHIDKETGSFFMRLEFEISNEEYNENKLLEKIGIIRNDLKMKISFHLYNKPLNVAIFSSRTQHCLYDLLIKNKCRDINFNPACIISNHKEIEDIANHFQIPFYYTPVNGNNEEVEEHQLSILKEHKIDLIVLARYMQVLSPKFISYYKDNIINVHHSFLPAFVGANPYKQAYQRGVKLIGATSHYVTEKLDEGPIIEQKVIRVSHKNSLEEFVSKGKELEKLALSEAVKKHIQRKVIVFEEKTVVFD